MKKLRKLKRSSRKINAAKAVDMAQWKNKPFWSGAVNLLDYEIEEVHSAKEAQGSDFHHSNYFSTSAIENIDSGEWAFFWIDENGINVSWRDQSISYKHPTLKKEIESQIKRLSADVSATHTLRKFKRSSRRVNVVAVDLQNPPQSALINMKPVGKVEKGEISSYKQNPNDMNSAARAAVYYAKKQSTPMIILQGNSYMNAIKVIQRLDEDPKKVVVMPGTYYCVVAKPDGNIYQGNVEVKSNNPVEAKKSPRTGSLIKVKASSDEAYLQAVESGDMETAQKMVDEAAENAGYKIKAYHGTTAGDFTEFKGRKWFSENPTKAEEYVTVLQPDGTNIPRLYSVYLKHRRKPVVIDFFATNDDVDKAFAKGKDMVLVEPVGSSSGGRVYVVRDASQVKSADPVTYDDQNNIIPLSQRFNPASNDIRSKKVEAAFWDSLDKVFEKGLAFYLGYMLTSSSTMVNDRTRNSFQAAFKDIGHKNQLSESEKDRIFSHLNSNALGLTEEGLEELWEAWCSDSI